MVGTAMTDVKSIPGTTVAEKLVISAGDDISPFPTVSSKTIVKFGTPASFGVPLSCTLYRREMVRGVKEAYYRQGGDSQESMRHDPDPPDENSINRVEPQQADGS
jgi:hypothetical protein